MLRLFRLFRLAALCSGGLFVSIGPAQTLYSVGDPTADEQLYLEYINRARADALVEAARLAAETDPNISSAYSFFGINRANIAPQFAWGVANSIFSQVAQPLAFNAKLLQAARLHSQDMFNNKFQGHTSSANPPAPLTPGGSLSTRVNTVGYSWSALGENVYAYADSVRQGHAGFDVDWGNLNTPTAPGYNAAFVGQGMQNPAGHRRNLHSNTYKEIGVGVLNGATGGVGPQIVTQDLGSPSGSSSAFITGVVYQDLNSNNFYDVGEGRAGVRVDVPGSNFYAISSTSGAYALPGFANGSWTVNFSGGGFASTAKTALVASGRNVKIDYLATTASFTPGDFNRDNLVNAADYTLWRQSFGSTTDLRADGNGNLRVDAADFTLWRDNRSAATVKAAGVPEPSAVVLVVLAMSVVMARVQRAQRS